jgi:hypothetical protein
MIDDAERYTYTIAVAAVVAGLSPRSIRRAIAGGHLPALRAAPNGSSGRPRILIRRRDLIAFVESFDRVEGRTAANVRDILARVSGRGRR